MTDSDPFPESNSPSGPPLRWVLASLALPMLLSSLATSIANVGLPTLAQAFDASFQQVQWVVLAYLIALTSVIVGVARFGDLAGRRRVLLSGILLFTGSSMLCGLATELNLLIAARAAQGLGAAAMMSLTMAFVAEAIPKARTGSAMGLLGTMSAIGTALGPTLGGILISTFGWQAIFFVNVPLGLLGFVLVQRCLPADHQSFTIDLSRSDPIGTSLLTATLAVYALAMTSGRDVFGSFGLALMVVAAFGVGLFLRVESRVASPLISPRMFRDPLLSARFTMSALVTTVVMATLVVGPFYLAGELALDATAVGFAMSCGPVAAALTGVPAGRLVDRLGSHCASIVGLVAMAAGSAALCSLPTDLGLPGYIVPLIVITAGYALFQAANNTAVMTDIDRNERGVVSGLLNLSRNLGLVTGASVMGAIFAVGSGSNGVTITSPEAVTAGMRITFATATVLVFIALAVACGSRLLARRTMQGAAMVDSGSS